MLHVFVLKLQLCVKYMHTLLGKNGKQHFDGLQTPSANAVML